MRLSHAILSGLLVSRLPHTPSPVWTIGTVVGVCRLREELLMPPVRSWLTRAATEVREDLLRLTEDDDEWE